MTSLYFFLKITHSIFYDTSFLLVLDKQLVTVWQPDKHPELQRSMEFISFFGSWKWMAFLSAIILIFTRFNAALRPYAFLITLITIGSIAATYLLKIYFNRPRPEVLHEAAIRSSYPSGHALVSLAIYGMIVYFCWVFSKKHWLNTLITIFLLAFVLSIGFSRIYLKQHFLSDVLSGFTGGLFWLAFSLGIGKAQMKIFR
ncbi:phosphatase PAP2 family protein [Adhaeribacter terreus]|uniref:Phosphatase PAP2 family protein n=1 Tax=Adhaeribacter terreus TaxID=529703 RepID=A0ABW0E766_9BACT